MWDVKKVMFYCDTKFQVEKHYGCELWKSQIPPWKVTLLFGTIQHWFCLFHSSHLGMCFNLKFCVAIKHHPLNIPHFFQNYLKLQNLFFSWFSPVSTECWFLYDILPPAARAIWVVRSDWPEPKPHGSYVCTVGFSLIERRSSSLSTTHAIPVVILFISTNCTLNSKYVLNMANDTWNALENQTHGIMVIAYRGNFYEAKQWSHRPLESELTRLLLETMVLHVRFSGLEGAIIKTCAKLYQKIPRGRESTPQAHIDFDDVRTPSEFSVIKIPTRPTPVAARRGRNVWNFSPFVRVWMRTRKATHKWFVHLIC